MRPSELRPEDHARLAAAQWLPMLGPFSAFDRRWSVRTDDPELAVLVADAFADLATNGGSPDNVADFRILQAQIGQRGLVTRDDVRIGFGRSPASLMGSLVWGINRWVIDEASRRLLLLHAAGVVRDDGLAVMLPARSESGKSTLTMGLLERGLTYLSDEAVCLLADGDVQGYAKPLSIDRGAWGLFPTYQPDGDTPGAAYLAEQWHVRASRISRVAASARLGAVIFPIYDPASRTSLLRLAPSEVIQRAANSTFAPEQGVAPETRQVHLLADELAGVPTYSLISSDLASGCREVLSVLDSLA